MHSRQPHGETQPIQAIWNHGGGIFSEVPFERLLSYRLGPIESGGEDFKKGNAS
jgi:hypothetical protein